MSYNVRINGSGEFLFCGVDDNPGNYADFYTNYEEALCEVLPDVREDCAARGYDDSQTARVVSHYEIAFSNWQGKWRFPQFDECDDIGKACG